MVLIGITSIILILFEISFREIVLFHYVSLLFIAVNVLYWSRRYSFALAVGIIVGFCTDLFLQSHFGETLFALFVPLLVLTFFDSLLRIEGGMSRTIFSAVGTAFSIVIREVLFELLFWEGALEVQAIINLIVVSVGIVLVINFFFGKFLLVDKKEGAFL